MRQRPWYRYILKLNSNRVSFRWANPNRQIPIRLLIFEDHYSLVIHETDPNTIDGHLLHTWTPPANFKLIVELVFAKCQGNKN